MYTTSQRADGRWAVSKDGEELRHWSYGSKASAQRYIRQQQRPREEPPMHIIGIAGKAESGKDTAAGFITAVYPRAYYRRAFADALKVEALEAWARQGKAPFTESILGSLIPGRVVLLANQLKVQDPAFRSFLQDFGTARRALEPEYWIRRLFFEHQGFSHYGLMDMVVPDVRHRNEAEHILAQGGLVLRLERPNHENRLTAEQRAHASETELDDWEESARYRVIENHGNPVELLRAVLREVDAYRGWRR